jgi:hypothetical protein
MGWRINRPQASGKELEHSTSARQGAVATIAKQGGEDTSSTAVASVIFDLNREFACNFPFVLGNMWCK